MAVSREEINQIAKATAAAVVERLNNNHHNNKISFKSCERPANKEVIKGEQCDSDGETYYHHTGIKNLASIRTNGALKPSPDPWTDGTVNFSLNPHLHRFGSVRFLFDRKRVESEISTEPMCYATGEDIWKEAEIVDRIQQERSKESKTMGRWRIEHELGIETPVYRNECQRYTTHPVPLKYVKKVEYWLPWQPGPFGSPTGCAVSPCSANWTAWSTGLPNAFEQVKKEIREAKDFAKGLGVPFGVETCYPYATLDRDEVVILDKENLNRLEREEEPIKKYRWEARLPAEECVCPPEEIPPPAQ